MNLECPHCAASLEIDEETRLGLEKVESFDCPACAGQVPSPFAKTSRKVGLSVFQSVNRNLLVLGSAAILVIGGIVTFLATRDPGSTTEVDRSINEKIIHNEFFTRLVESGATTYDDLREIDHFAAYGDGYVGLSGAMMNWPAAQAYARRLGGAVLDIALVPEESRREMGEWLAEAIPVLPGRCVWIADQGLPCGLDAPDRFPDANDGLVPGALGWGLDAPGKSPDAQEQNRFRVLVAWPTESPWINLGWKWMIEPKYDEVRPFSKWGFAIVRTGNQWGIIDQDGETVLEPKYDEITDFSEHGCARLSVDGKWGLVDRNGSLVAKPEWDEIQDLINGFIPVQREGKWGYLNDKGELAIPLQWDGAWRFTPEGYAVVIRHVEGPERAIYHPQQGRILVTYDPKRGIIDRTGKIIVEPIWDGAIPFSKEGLGLLRKSGASWALVNTSGKILHAPTLDLFWRERRLDLGYLPHTGGLIGKDGKPAGAFEEAYHERVLAAEGRFREGLARDDSEEGTRFVDPMGETVIEAKGYSCRDFRNGFAAAEKDGKWGFLDRTGKLVIDAVWDEVGDFSPIGKVSVKRGELWGWMNKDGTLISEPLWDEVRPFKDGVSAVKRIESWGYMDERGKILVDPTSRYSGDFARDLAAGLLDSHKDSLRKYFLSSDEESRARAVQAEPMKHLERILFGGLIQRFPAYDRLPYYDRYGLTSTPGHIRDTEGNLILTHIGEDRSRKVGGLLSDYLGDFVPYAEPPKYGIMDTKGNVLVPPRWDYAQVRSADRVIITVKDKKGLVDGQGRVLIQPEWDELEILTVRSSALDEDGKTLLFGKGVVLGGIGTRFLSPWVQVKRDGQSLILLDDGTPALPETMAGATYVDFYGTGHVVIKETDTDGKELRSLYHPKTGVRTSFPGASKLHYNWNTAHYGFIWELVEVDGKPTWRLRNVRGADPGHTQPGTEEPVGWGFMQERARLHDGVGWYFIDPEGKAISPERWEDLRDFREGFAAVKRDGKWGFIGRDGKALAECVYDEALDFHEGLAAVKTEGRWGFVDSSGAMAIAPVWDEAQSFARWSGPVKSADLKRPYLPVAEVKINGAAAIIGRDGGLIADPRAPKVHRKGSAFFNGNEPLVVTETNGKVALVNPQSEGLSYDLRLDPFSPNLLTHNPSRGKYGLNRLDGSVALEANYDQIQWVAPGIAAVWNQGEGGLIGGDGTWLFKDNEQMRIARFATGRGRTNEEFRHGLVVIEDPPRWGFLRLNRPTSQ